MDRPASQTRAQLQNCAPSSPSGCEASLPDSVLLGPTCSVFVWGPIYPADAR